MRRMRSLRAARAMHGGAAMRSLVLIALVACSHPAHTGDDTGDGGKTDGDGTIDGAPPSIWHPHPKTSWQWQLEGAIDTSFAVAMYDIDMIEGASVIDRLHADGRIVIC